MSDFVGVVIGLTVAAALVIGAFFATLWIYSYVRVMNATSIGKAEFAQAEQNRQIKIKTAEAERDAAKLQAEAIQIVGEAAKAYPEYRHQEFLSAFGEALREGKMNQVIYVPTEANIPLMEAGKR
jgi:regulator of protease activity HflC (stomatin/prohibitin superfamily)